MKIRYTETVEYDITEEQYLTIPLDLRDRTLKQWGREILDEAPPDQVQQSWMLVNGGLVRVSGPMCVFSLEQFEQFVEELGDDFDDRGVGYYATVVDGFVYRSDNIWCGKKWGEDNGYQNVIWVEW